MLKLVITITILGLLNPLIQAQERSVSGVITSSEDGMSIPGVTISVNGTQRGTISGTDGSYSIVVSRGETLVFSFVGMETEVVQVIDQTLINITLNPATEELDEVVVVGYGTRKRSDLTGSVSSVGAEDLNSIPTTNVAEMLRGKTAGVQVTLGSARPGGSSSILIRGRNSLSGSNDPLYIVDGIPVDDINFLNMRDVASMEILKDASAQAIYGARASNGVILITTSRGKEGRMTVSYDSYAGMQTVNKNFRVMNAEEWVEFRREGYRADANSFFLDTASNWKEYLPDDMILDEVMYRAWENQEEIDWEELVTQNAFIQKHDLSLKGGDENTRVAVSLGYFDQEGIRPESGFKRYNLRVNLDQDVNKWLSFGSNLYYSHQRQELEASSSYFDYLTLPPLAEPYDETGELQLYVTQDDRHRNPLFNNQESERHRIQNQAIINLYSEVRILKGLKYKLNLSGTSRFTEDNSYLSTRHEKGREYVVYDPDDPQADPIGNGGEATIRNTTNYDLLLENIITYNLKSGIHQFDVTLMQGFNHRSYRDLTTVSRNFIFDILSYNGIGNGLTPIPPLLEGNKRSLVSFMGRVRYSILDRYLITFSARADGSSVFGNNNKYGVFPALAIGWKIHNESFMDDFSFISMLKLRGSYGSIGNEAIPPYTTLGITKPLAYTLDLGRTNIGYLPDSEAFPNYDLRWETSTTANLGLDFSFWSGRLTGSLEAYQTRTTDLLVNRRVPSASGYMRMWDNLAETKNVGYEAIIGAYILSREDLSWQIDLSYSRNRNQIVKIDGKLDEEGNPVNDEANLWFVGEPINVYYYWQFDGIWQMGEEYDLMSSARPGDVRLADLNGDGTINADDRRVYHKDPDWYGGFSTSITYHGFDFSIFWDFLVGGVKRNDFLYNGEYGAYKPIFNTIQLDYWTPENQSNQYPRPYVDGSQSQYKKAISYQNQSFVRLRTLTLGYSLPDGVAQKIRTSRLRVYFTGTNLWTHTEFKSYSPEVSPSSYPEGKTYIMGLNVTF